MKVIILAAGIGSRLKPLTDIKPKGMVRVNDTPIIGHQIESYLEAGIIESDINVAIGYKAEFIISYLNIEYPQTKVIVNNLYSTTNNMYSLNLCLNSFIEDDTVISNGDCVYEPGIIRDFINSEYKNSVACDKGSYSDENMKIIVENNIIKHISKQIANIDSYGNSIDLYKIEKKSILIIKDIIKNMINDDPNLWTELALDKLFDHINFIPFDIQGKNWMEIDNHEDLYEAEKKFSQFSIQTKKVVILDLDGTVYLGDRPITGAIDFIKKNSNKFDIYYITNNTSKNLNDYIKKLKNFGITVSLNQIISPLIPLVDYLKSNSIKNIFIVGNSNFKKYLKEEISTLNFTNDKNICEAVIVAYDTELNYEKLKIASLLLHNDIKLLATHEDIVCPTEHGDIPDIGSILKILELTTKRKPDLIFGKPNPVLLDSIVGKYNKEDIVIVGDRLYTDKVLANNANIDFVMVLSGETKRVDIEAIEIFPEAIVKDLGDIF